MKWKYCILIGLIFFGIGFVVGWHPAFESVRNYVVSGISLGVVIELVGHLREWYKDRIEEKSRRCKELEGNLRNHSTDLVRIIGSIDFLTLNSGDWHRAVSHLKAEEYIIEGTQLMDFCRETKALTDEIKALDTENKFVDGKVKEFRKEMYKIRDDFETGHYILKCTCDRCKPWVDELKTLDKSYYKKLISPD